MRDTGIGIPQAKLTKIFDEKESDQSGANYDGTGLGLSICAQLCQQIGAFIRYTSRQGEHSGSIFLLYIEDNSEDDFYEYDENITMD